MTRLLALRKPARAAITLLAGFLPALAIARPTPADQAVAAAERRVSQAHDRPEAYVELATAFMKKSREGNPGYYARASAALDRALALDPNDYPALRVRAWVLLGQHDFRAFRASDCGRKNTVRLIRTFEVERRGALIRCEVEGTAFLKNMVRIMVGTLVQAGHGELDAAGVDRLLAAGDRTQSGVTAPAHGLTLVRVTY